MVCFLSNKQNTANCFRCGCHSKVFNLPYGVPQGSSLGPLLFTIYASKLFNIIKTHLPSVHAFADDTQLYLSFKASSTTSQAEALVALQDCISSIRAWMLVDKLKLNDDKTEIIIIGTRAQLQKIDIKNLQVGNTNVDISNSEIRNLCVWFDSTLSMAPHINKICQSAYYHLYNIRKIRKFLTYDQTKLIVQSVIMSRIDYCNSLLY